MDLKTFIGDPNGDSFTCRESTSTEGAASFPHSPGAFALSSDCVLTWDLTGYAPGDLPKFGTAIMIESGVGGSTAKVPIDFIIEILAGNPFTCDASGLGLVDFTVPLGATVTADFEVNGGPGGSTETDVSCLSVQIPIVLKCSLTSMNLFLENC